MKKHLILISNIIAFVNILALMATGVILRWVLPPGSGGGHGFRGGRGPRTEPKTFLDWGRHDWGDAHFWLAVIFTCMIVVHLVLNWPWIRATFFPRKPKREPSAATG
ncbi:MAG: DUF4405 domain-containing protein [Planctomycetes bacterium]|nr:DUF4405 domain-containing protein [Planctomycetota bacterium]